MNQSKDKMDKSNQLTNLKRNKISKQTSKMDNTHKLQKILNISELPHPKTVLVAVALGLLSVNEDKEEEELSKEDEPPKKKRKV